MVHAAICEDGWTDLIQNDSSIFDTFNQLSATRTTREFFDLLCLVEALRTGYNPMPEVTRGSCPPELPEKGEELEEILDEVDRALKKPGATVRTVYEALWNDYE